MFKIEKKKMVNKCFRFPAKLLEALQKISVEENISLNNLIVQCCEYSLKNLEK